MENLNNHVSNIFNQINALKRSFIYLDDNKTSDNEDYTLNIYRSLGKLELQLRGLQKDIREMENKA